MPGLSETNIPLPYQIVLLTFTYHSLAFCLPYLDPEDIERVTDKTRKLGLIVVRGTQVSLVSPQEGVEEIANPFIAAEE
jgi:hypothetical protein